MSDCSTCLVHSFDEWLEGLDDGRSDVGDELYRPLTEIRSGLVRVDRPEAVRQERHSQLPRLPTTLQAHHVPPEVVQVEVSTARNEASALAQLRQQATLGWLTRSAGGPRHAQRPPDGPRGLAIEHPDGSIVYTVYSPDMRAVEYRQMIRPPRRARRGSQPVAPRPRPRSARARREHARAVQDAAAAREQRAANAINRVVRRGATPNAQPQQLIRAKPGVTASGPDLVPGRLRASRGSSFAVE
jgi:hypothetical protein